MWLLQERFIEKKDILDLLKMLRFVEGQIALPNLLTVESKFERKEIIGKRLVLLYIGQGTLRTVSKYGVHNLQVWLDYVRESFGQIRNVFLLWYDDGLISSLSKEMEQDDFLGCYLNIRELSEIYKQEKQKYQECLWADHIQSVQIDALAEVAYACYGDIGKLSGIMTAQGKLFVQADWMLLCDTPQSKTLNDWIKSVLQSGSQDIPDEWQRKIQGKHVVLYCLRAETLLHYGLAAVGKINYVISCMSGQSELLLWWLEDQRILELLPSLREDVRVRYLEVRKNFQQGTGIFDESGNAHRAMGWADAYYGDWIDEIRLLHRWGKPSLLQDIPGTMASNGELTQAVPFWPTAACFVDDDIWFVHGKLALLCRYSKKSRRTEFIERIPGKYFLLESLYRGICYYQGKIFLLPSWAEGRIVIYYIQEHRFDYLQIPDCEDAKGSLFREVFVYGRYIYAMPQFYRYVLRIDMETLEVNSAGDCLGLAKSISPKARYMNDVVKVNEHVVAGVFTNTNLVMMYDFDSEKIHMLRVGENDASYTSLTCLHGELFLCNAAGNKLLKYSISMDKVVESYSVPFDSYIVHRFPDDTIMLDSVKDGCFCKINSDGKVIDKGQREIWPDKNPLSYSYTSGMTVADGDDLWYFSRCDYRAYCYHKKGTTDVFDFPWSDMDENFYSSQIVKMTIRDNNTELPSGDALLEIKELMKKCEMEENDSKNGERIYKGIRGLLKS